ncbi:MAG: hypothetical protein WBZ42_04185, partial [Halobacteriota archaeon]
AVAKTNAYGTITWPQSWTTSGSTTFVAAFAGDGAYAKSQSAAMTISALKIQTKLTLTLYDWQIENFFYYHVHAKGRLTDLTGNSLNKVETITFTAIRESGLEQPDYRDLGSTQTDEHGYYDTQLDLFSTLPMNNFQAHFAGDSRYYPSDSNII